MKKIFLIIIAVFLLPCVSFSCAAKKKVKATFNNTSNVPTRIEKEARDECQIASDNEPADEYRAYGSGISNTRDFARQKATLYAKAELASRMSSQILNVMKAYRNDMGVGEKKLNEEDIKQDIGMMSEMVIENCKIVCSDVYRLSDGSFECVVCVSIPAIKAEAISGAAAMNEDERAKVEFNEDQFRKSYREELEEFRRLRKEQK